VSQTATNKILKRVLIEQGVTAGGGVLWEREARGRRYSAISACLVTPSGLSRIEVCRWIDGQS
jgi:fatty-acyl-CoA synthase